MDCTEDRTLLYVEDEDAAVPLIDIALKEARIDAQLFRVADGEQAFAFLNRSDGYRGAPAPRLILLDLNLPKIHGLEILMRIKSCKTCRSIPVVVFTSSSLPHDRENALAFGAEGYITKPADFDGLIEAVRTAWSFAALPVSPLVSC